MADAMQRCEKPAFFFLPLQLAKRSPCRIRQVKDVKIKVSLI